MQLHEQLKAGTLLDTLHTLLVEHYNVPLDDIVNDVFSQLYRTDTFITSVDISKIYAIMQKYFTSASFITPNFPNEDFFLANARTCVEYILPQDIIMSVFDNLEACLQRETPDISIYAINGKTRFLGFNSLTKLSEDGKSYNISCAENKLCNHLCIYDRNQLAPVLRALYKKAEKNNHLQLVDTLSFINDKRESSKSYTVPTCGANVIYLLSEIQPDVLSLININALESDPQLVENHIATLSCTLLAYYDIFWDDAKFYYVYEKEPHSLPYNNTDEALLRYRLERLFHRNFIYKQTSNYEYLIYALINEQFYNPYHDYSIKDYEPTRLAALFSACSKVPNIYSQNDLLTALFKTSSQYELLIDYNRMKWLDQLTDLFRYTNDIIYAAMESTFFYLLYSITQKLYFYDTASFESIEIIKQMYQILNAEIFNNQSEFCIFSNYAKPITFNTESKLLYQIISKALIHKPIWKSKAITQTKLLSYSLNNINLSILQNAECYFAKDNLLDKSPASTKP